MENEMQQTTMSKKCGHEGMCGCGSRWTSEHFQLYVLKRLMGVILILLVFWFGLRLGELRTLSQVQRQQNPQFMVVGGGDWNQPGNMMNR